MRLRVQVAEAAYVDKRSSDVVMFELVPHYVTDPAEEAVGSGVQPPSWPRGPCVRDSDLLQALHTQLRRKHPHLLFPRFPRVDRQTPGWGSEGLLQTLRRRMERYFVRLLDRSELQTDGVLQAFMMERGPKEAAQVLEDGVEASSQRRPLGLRVLWPPNWFGSRSMSASSSLSLSPSLDGSQEIVIDKDVPDDRIIEYSPVHVEEAPEEVRMREMMARSVLIREDSLRALFSSTRKVVGALRRYSEQMRRLSEAFCGVTLAHVRHLVSNLEDARSTHSSLLQVQSLQEEQRTVERRFRELGDRFADLISRLEPGWERMGQLVSTTAGEVTAGQIEEMANVKEYLNVEVNALRRYDVQTGKRMMVQARHDAIEAEGDSRRTTRMHELAEAKAALEHSVDAEMHLRSRLEEKSRHMRSEMDVFWKQTSNELFQSVLQVMKDTIEISKGQVSAIQEWLPAAEGGSEQPLTM